MKGVRIEKKEFRTVRRISITAGIVLSLLPLLFLMMVPIHAYASADYESSDKIEYQSCQKTAVVSEKKSKRVGENTEKVKGVTSTQTIEKTNTKKNYQQDSIPLPYGIQGTMQKACNQYGIPYSLALAVCQTESAFQPDAQNGTSTGYMQIKRMNFDRLSNITGYNPELPDGNIVCGICFLAEKVNGYKSIPLGLMAYNCGDYGASKLWKQGIYETVYTRTVMARKNAWEAVLNEENQQQ